MNNTIRLYGLVAESIVDGKGYRAAVFTQGCPHRCEGCHNPGSHDPEGGTVWSLDDVEKKFASDPLLDGITLTGGEPFVQPAECAELARRAHAKNLSVWTYTGYTLEKLNAMAAGNADVKALLAETDVLIDGPFLLGERSLTLTFRGSRNQRVIDMKETRVRGTVILWEAEEWR
jgi:anaerobic ribonucleoside-triphosphate reductase activating protein